MIRLYKQDETGKPVAYHEAWIEPQNRRIVEHWGYIGEAGETATHRIKIFGSLEKQFQQVLEPARNLGFEELPESAFSTLVIEYAASGDGDDDRDKQEDIEDALSEKLGWTGLGFCDEGRIIGGKIEICCRVLDAEIAETVIAEALDGSVFADYSRIYQE
ncbi:MAG: hypothetical protein ACX94B_02865 [Henriciella sp.]